MRVRHGTGGVRARSRVTGQGQGQAQEYERVRVRVYEKGVMVRIRAKGKGVQVWVKARERAWVRVKAWLGATGVEYMSKGIAMGTGNDLGRVKGVMAIVWGKSKVEGEV